MDAKAETNEPKLYTVEEARTVLKISRPMLYKLMDAGKLRYAKLGTRRLIPQSEVVKLIDDSMVA